EGQEEETEPRRLSSHCSSYVSLAMFRRLLLVPVLAFACAKDPGAIPAGGPGGATPSKPGGGSFRVGNQVKGVEAQPDYDAEAEEIRQSVEGTLPSPLPSPKAACNTMFDAVISMYRRVDGGGARSVKLLEAAREADQASCESETTSAAAACVAVLITRDGGEFAWLLDQCSRAFPS
ncbi:MAG: hypothetical protein KUG77_26560, partial [Nannocystaceae bacterium]|nr:hypothetical protein [Nannocystaceae bacterium]